MGNYQQFKYWLKNVSFLTEADCNLFEPHLQTKLRSRSRLRECELFYSLWLYFKSPISTKTFANKTSDIKIPLVVGVPTSLKNLGEILP